MVEQLTLKFFLLGASPELAHRIAHAWVAKGLVL